jgi:hypothetical protein
MIQEFQLGEESKVKWEDRLILHKLWLQKNHRDIQKKIKEKNKTESELPYDLEKEKM